MKNMGRRTHLLFGIIFATFYLSNGCQIDGVTNWLIPVSESIVDTFRGTVFSRSTSNIEGINSVNFFEGLNGGPYLDVSFTDSQFNIVTNAAYADYEEKETAQSFSFTIIFRCTGGGTSTLVFLLNVVDTNNNAPQFMPTSNYEFTIAPPIPPGFLVTGCFNDITVRDIDLTTQRIVYEIEENQYFSIEYDASSSTVAKEFKATLKTTSFIRSIPEPITLRITATDVDLTGDPARSTTATVTIIGDSEFEFPEEPVFSQPFYTANYTKDHQLVVHDAIALQQGFDNQVSFSLEGERSSNFGLAANDNQISLSVVTHLPLEDITESQIILVVRANREYTTGDTAPVIVQLPEEASLEFERAHYEGSIVNNALQLSQLTLSQGYDTSSLSVDVISVHSSYFSVNLQGNQITVTMSPLTEDIINNNNFVYLQIVATTDRSSASAIITLEIIKDDTVTPVFNQPIFTGTYDSATGLSIEQIIIIQGYDETVSVNLDGEHASYFQLAQTGSAITLTSSVIPPELFSEQRILLSVRATKPRTVGANAAVIIALPEDIQNAVSFGKVLYTGLLQLGVVQHESITISGFTGTSVQLLGEYASAFEAVVSNGVVTVQRSGAVTLPSTVTQVMLELHADSASAVLLLNVIESENPVLPSVSFSSPSYVLQVGDDQTGIIGRVEATADNMEILKYSLVIDNDHLQSRISINNEGEIHLSAPAASGAYTLQVVATTIITQVSGSATVYLSIETVSTGEENNTTIPPLIILNRDEEETHDNLVVLDGIQFDGCRYTLINRWPADQTWLYVDDIGLHTRAIDREHESIAFMALSQVQVELILHCDSDPPTRTKRSTDDLAASKMETALGPYDYGTKNWIITDTIPYNSRRSFVNLIVNDINDNAPIFVGKENEPIVVGYPVPELEDTVLPRSLAELKATDADIGENAAILYWSSEAELAVAPLTGFVHVRDGARLEHDSRLTVNATDLNGEGHTGSIDLQIKLLDVNNIIVVTIRDAFLNDEKTILENLSTAVGYEVKVLSSAVISGDIEDGNTRRKRETTDLAGASLQLYVYGLIEREPVAIQRLITDINNNAVATIHIASALSLEDHLEGQEICVIGGHDIGLLVSTIVLSILLFILIVLVVLWFSRKWIWRQNYQEFTDENSLASRRESLPEPTKLESSTKPRLNIEELKRSERRLQEMLDAPVRDVVIEPTIAKIDAPVESKVDMTSIDSRTPIVIQSIDKLKDGVDESSSDDEFGEKQRAKRKSVVTFNENVEKIIHVDDPEDVSPESDYEVYKL